MTGKIQAVAVPGEFHQFKALTGEFNLGELNFDHQFSIEEPSRKMHFTKSLKSPCKTHIPILASCEAYFLQYIENKLFYD